MSDIFYKVHNLLNSGKNIFEISSELGVSPVKIIEIAEKKKEEQELAQRFHSSEIERNVLVRFLEMDRQYKEDLALIEKEIEEKGFDNKLLEQKRKIRENLGKNLLKELEISQKNNSINSNGDRSIEDGIEALLCSIRENKS